MVDVVYICEAVAIAPLGITVVISHGFPRMIAFKDVMDATPNEINLRVCRTRAEYRTLLASLQAAFEQRGVEVLRLKKTTHEMQEIRTARGRA